MKKNIFILLTIFTFFCASCAKAQTLGAGVSVDSQGNLIINAPLYVFDRYGENPKLEKAPTSINYEVDVGIYNSQKDDSNSHEFIGEIKKGRLSITIRKPNENLLIEAMKFWHISENFFTNGSNVKIGELSLSTVKRDYIWIRLYPNLNAARILEEPITDERKYFIDDGHCEFFYSLGEVNITGKVYEPKLTNWHYEFNLHLKQGWNIVNERFYYDVKEEIEALTSITLSKDAVWVLY